MWNYVCDGCSRSIEKNNFERNTWYIKDNKVYCPTCCKTQIHKQISRTISLRPHLRFDAILTILGLKDDISHMLDAVVLSMVNNKIKILIKKDKEDEGTIETRG